MNKIVSTDFITDDVQRLVPVDATATTPKNAAVAKLMKAWEAKTTQRAAKATGFTLMAVSLAACNDDDTATTTPTTPTTPVTPAGQTFTLTTGVDNIVGTAGNDTIVSAVVGTAGATLTAADVIDGGAGIDTLNITTVAGAADVLAGALISNIEVVGIRATTNDNVTLNALNVVGLTNVNLTGIGTGTVGLSNLSSGATVTVGSGANLTGLITSGYAAAATTANIPYAGGTSGAVTVTGAGVTTVNIASTGAANVAGAIDVAGATTINIAAATNFTATSIATTGVSSTLNVSGAATSVDVGTLDTDLRTIDASGMTAGGLTATLSNAAQVVTGGSGNDVISTGGLGLLTGSVNAGAGTGDRLIVTATADLDTAAKGAKYTNFETLQVNDAVSVDLDNISGITAIRINDGVGATAVINLTAVQAAAITMIAGNGAATIGVKGATTVGQIDTVKITYNDGDTTLNEAFGAASTLTLAGVENLEVTAVDQAALTQSAAASGSLTSVKLFGAGNHSFTTGNMATSNFTLDASGSTGTNTLSAATFATNGVSIKGGSGADTITGSGQADVIDAGAGNDRINSSVGKDTMTLGAGNDIVVYGAGSDANTFVGADFAARIASVDDISDFGNGSNKLNFVDFVGATTLIAQATVQAAVGTAATLEAAFTNAATVIGANQVVSRMWWKFSGGDPRAL